MGGDDLVLTLRMRDEAKAVLAGFTKEMQQTGSISKQMADKLNLTNKAMRDAEGISKQLSGSMANTGGAFRNVARDMNNLQGAGLRVSSSLLGVVRMYGPLLGFAGGMLAVGSGLKTAVSSSNEFERSLRDMQALVGVSRQQLNAWKGDMEQIAVSFGRDPQEVAKAMYFITSSGFEGAEALDVLKASAEGAGAGMGDMQTIADAATSAVNAYGHGNLTAADAIGVMLEAVKVGKMEPAELAASMGQALGVASAAGVSFRDVAAAVASLSLVGIKAAEGVTTVRQTLLAVSAPTQQVQQMFNNLNGVTKSSIKSFHEFADQWKQIQQVFRQEGYLAGIKKLQELANKFAMPTVAMKMMLHDVQAVNAAMLLTGANAKTIDEIFQDVGKAGAKSLEDAWKAAAASSATTFAQFSAAMKVTFIQIGDAIAPSLAKGASAVVQAFNFVRQNAVELKQDIVALGIAGAAAFAMIKREAIAALAVSILGPFGVGLELLAGQFIMVEGAALTASGAIVSFEAILAATGWGALVLAIGAGVYALEKFTTAQSQAAYAAALHKQVQDGLAATSRIVADDTQKLATATGEERTRTLESVNADRAKIASLHDRTVQALKAAQAELTLARAAAERGSALSAAGSSVIRHTSNLPAPLNSIGVLVGGGLEALGGHQNAKNKEAQDRAQAKTDELKALADGYQKQYDEITAQINAPPPNSKPTGDLDPFRLPGGGSKKGHKGGESEAAKDLKDQRKALADWSIETQRANAMANLLRGTMEGAGGEMVVFGGLDELTFQQKSAELDALYAKRQKAQDRAIDKGHVLSAQDMQAIQLTKEEKAAIDDKVAATLREDQEKNVRAYRQQVADLNSGAKLLDTQVSTQTDLLVIEEARSLMSKNRLMDMETALGLARQMVSAKLKEAQATADANARIDVKRTQDDLQARMSIGFNTDNKQQQVAIALLEEKEKREAEGVQMSPAIIAATRAKAEAQYELNKAQQEWNDKKAEADGFFDSFATFFHDSIFGAKSLKDAIHDLIGSLIDLIWQYELLLPLKRAFDSSMGSGGGGFFGSILSAFGLGGGGTPFDVSGATADINASLGYAKGGVFSNGAPIPFAKGGVVDRTTLFPISGGKTGMMGEAGPEAIVPLKRNSRGELGLAGGGGQSVFAPSIAIQVTAPEGVDDPTAWGKVISDAIDVRLHKFVEEQTRYGGAFWGARR